jgi:lipoic acid synthetase/lipoate-protein ligase A
MTHLLLPQDATRRLSFYLAMEEFAARRLNTDDDLFFLWQVEPTVIFGRNQVIENEVNLDYCREHGISVYRRKSGGGCVYADRDNLMWSFVMQTENVGFAFNRFLGMVLLVLRKMGIEATGTSHNDIMIGSRKLCGTACRKTAKGCIVHSTMLYDTNMEHMLNAITPGPEKLERKGIASVRQRVTLLKEYTSLGLEEVKALIRETLCRGERRLTQEEIGRIEELKQIIYGN